MPNKDFTKMSEQKPCKSLHLWSHALPMDKFILKCSIYWVNTALERLWPTYWTFKKSSFSHLSMSSVELVHPASIPVTFASRLLAIWLIGPKNQWPHKHKQRKLSLWTHYRLNWDYPHYHPLPHEGVKYNGNVKCFLVYWV